jgi:hypothetical protein
MSDKKSSRESSSNTNTGTNSSTTTGTTVAADRAKDMLTYQALLQNEMFGTHIDCLYDEQHLQNAYSNGNSNHHNTTGTTNQTGNTDTNNNVGTTTTTTTVIAQGLGSQIHTTAISAINVDTDVLFSIVQKLYKKYILGHSYTITWFSISIFSTTFTIYKFKFKSITNT